MIKNNTMTKTIKKLYRDEKHEIIGWVCAWMWDYFNVDPVLIRAIFVVFWLAWWFAVWLYIILWIITPSKKH